MRLAKVQNYQTPNEIVRHRIQEIEPLSYGVQVYTDKDKVKFVEKTEKVIRGSIEYKDYVAYLKDNIAMNRGSFFQNITNQNRRFSIHIHHEPFTLFDITLAVYNRFIKEGIPLNYFDIAEEVMMLHYQNMVGLIPLTQTTHELMHDGQLFIPLQSVYGNFVKFYQHYEPFIENDTKAILHSKIKMSKENTINDMTVLDKRYVYLISPNVTQLQPIEL